MNGGKNSVDVKSKELKMAEVISKGIYVPPSWHSALCQELQLLRHAHHSLFLSCIPNLVTCALTQPCGDL